MLYLYTQGWIALGNANNGGKDISNEDQKLVDCIDNMIRDKYERAIMMQNPNKILT
jgi:hypothetical protein